jgi:hypothetical protein
METNNKKQTSPKTEPAKTSKLKRERNYKPVNGETPEQTKARKENERIEKRNAFLQNQSEISKEIKEDLKQRLILQNEQNKKYQGKRYTAEMRDALFDEIINEIESGQSVANSVNKYKVAAQTFFQWCDEDTNKFKRYARAHTKRADALFDKMVDVAVNMPDVNRARLVNDTIKYVCARISPEKYSEKQTINIIGNLNQNITTLSPEDRDEKIKQLYLKAQNYIDVTPQ